MGYFLPQNAKKAPCKNRITNRKMFSKELLICLPQFPNPLWFLGVESKKKAQENV